jgi:hypothetical protein
MTALRDAIGVAVNSVGKRLADTEEDKRPSKITVLVITDGQENSSREFTNAQIKEMIQHQTSKYNWSFVFLGGGTEADFEAQEAQGRGLGFGNAISYSNSSAGVASLYNVVSDGITRMRRGISDSFSVSKEEKERLKKDWQPPQEDAEAFRNAIKPKLKD